MKLDWIGRRVVSVSTLGVSLLVLGFAVAPKPVASQTDATSPDGRCIGCSVDGKTTPRTPDGHPDLSGYWGGGGGGAPAPVAAPGTAAAPAAAAANANAPRATQGGGQQLERSKDGSILFDFGADIENQSFCTDASCQAPNQPPYNAEYMAKVKQIAATEFGGTTPLDPQMDCKPLGVPRAAGAMQIVQNKDAIAILYEGAPYSTFRLIYTDGRGHTQDPDPTFFGESIGHWEGDTLVVDTIGLNDETWLGGGVGGRTMYTSVHSEKEHVVERWTRDGDVLTDEVTVDDPAAFTKPWVLAPRRIRIARPGMMLFETGCTPDKAHFIKPNPEDKDIKNKCAFLCGEGDAGYQPTK